MTKTAQNFYYGLAAFVFIGFMATFTFAAGLTPPAGTTNLALHKKVTFAPAPNYWLTRKGGTDATDLTDGKITQRADQEIWRDSSSVGWRYPGRANLTVDLGKMCHINEIAMRFCGGSPHPIEEMPPWVEVFVSKDGKHYRKIGSYWRWRKGDFKKFGVPQAVGKAWVYAIPFKNINATGRYVGIRFYGTGTTSSDELYVFGTPVKKTQKKPAPTGKPSGFSVNQPQLYFNKPYLKLATNVVLPVPVGMTTPGGKYMRQKYNITFTLPPGIIIPSGVIRGVWVKDIQKQVLDNGWTKYHWTINTQKNSKKVGRLFVVASGWKDGQAGKIYYQFGNKNWQSPKLSIPVTAVTLTKPPKVKGVMLSMGWWGTGISQHWPNVLKAFDMIGLNTFNVFSERMPEDKNSPQWQLLAQARKAGFYISDIDLPYYHYTFVRHKYGGLPKAASKQIYHQFADGSTGGGLCPSYRGKYFKEEVKLYAQHIASVRPEFAALDIEPWGWDGPEAECKKCVRCQKSFKKSGLNSWQAWQEMMGRQIWGALVRSARKASKAAGGPPIQTGGYDFRADYSFKNNDAYQNVFSFHQLYPKLLSFSQPSVYMSYQPYSLINLGNVIRNGRRHIGKNDIMPWISPGDSGVFPGKAFKWGLLECYLNGARGIWFWSSRTWDSENLIAYNHVIHAIAPIQKMILNGQLIGRAAQAVGPGQISGLALDNRVALLVSDFFNQTQGAVTVYLRLPAQGKYVVRDLLNNNKVIGHLASGQHTLKVKLNGQSARLLLLEPIQ